MPEKVEIINIYAGPDPPKVKPHRRGGEKYGKAKKPAKAGKVKVGGKRERAGFFAALLRMLGFGRKKVERAKAVEKAGVEREKVELEKVLMEKRVLGEELRRRLKEKRKPWKEKLEREKVKRVRKKAKRVVEREKALRKLGKAREVEKEGVGVSGAEAAVAPSAKVVYGVPKEEETVEEKIDYYKKLMKRLKYDFYKRKISGEEYKKGMFEYQQKLRKLEEKKKAEEVKKKVKVKKKVARKKAVRAERKVRKKRKVKIRGRKIGAEEEVGGKEAVEVVGKLATAIEKLVSVKKPAEVEPKKIPAGEFKKVVPVEGKERVKIGAEELDLGGWFAGRMRRQREIRKELVEKMARQKELERIELATSGITAEEPRRELGKIKIAAKVGGEKVDAEVLVKIEDNIKELLRKHNIPEDEIAEEISRVEKGKIISRFDKIADIAELERRAQRLIERMTEHEPKSIMPGGLPGLPTIVGGIKKREELKAIAKEITKHRVVTDFDRLLNLVKSEGIISAGKAKKQLGMESKTFNEMCEILEDSGLVILKYPAIGPMRIIDVAYKKRTKEKKSHKKGKKEKIIEEAEERG